MRNKYAFISILVSLSLLFILWPPNIIAEEPLSLKSAVSEALKSNPEILAAKNNYLAAKMKVPQELAPDEDPMLEYSYDEMRAGVADLMGKPMRTYAVSQKMPFPTKLFLRSAIASKDVKILYESWKEKEREIIARTKSAYFELWLLGKSIGITNESQALLEQFSSSTASRYALGKASQQDALKAQVEVAKVKNNLTVLNQKREIAKANLSILLNRSPESDFAIENESKIPDTMHSIDELYKIAKENRPKLKAFKYAVEKGRTAYLLAWNEFLPDLSARYEQMIVENRGDKWAGMVSLSVPAWFWVKQGPGVAQMKSELDMFKAEYRTMENMTLFDVKEAHARVESYKRLIETFETSFIPQAEQTLKASLTGYEANQIDFLNLLDSQRMLLEIKLDYYKMVGDLEMAKAELERAVGVDL